MLIASVSLHRPADGEGVVVVDEDRYYNKHRLSRRDDVVGDRVE